MDMDMEIDIKYEPVEVKNECADAGVFAVPVNQEEEPESPIEVIYDSRGDRHRHCNGSSDVPTFGSPIVIGTFTDPLGKNGPTSRWIVELLNNSDNEEFVLPDCPDSISADSTSIQSVQVEPGRESTVKQEYIDLVEEVDTNDSPEFLRAVTDTVEQTSLLKSEDPLSDKVIFCGGYKVEQDRELE